MNSMKKIAAFTLLILSAVNGFGDGAKIPLPKDTWLSQSGHTLDLSWEGLTKPTWFEIEFGQLTDVTLKCEVKFTDASDNPVSYFDIQHSGVVCLLSPSDFPFQSYDKSTGITFGTTEINNLGHKNGFYFLRFEVGERNIHYKADVRWTTSPLPKPPPGVNATAPAQAEKAREQIQQQQAQAEQQRQETIRAVQAEQRRQEQAQAQAALQAQQIELQRAEQARQEQIRLQQAERARQEQIRQQQAQVEQQRQEQIRLVREQQEQAERQRVYAQAELQRQERERQWQAEQKQKEEDYQKRLQEGRELQERIRQQNEQAEREAQQQKEQWAQALRAQQAQAALQAQQIESQRAEQARQEQFRREQQARQQQQQVGAVFGMFDMIKSAQEQGAQERAAREQAAQEQAAREQAFREQAAREQAAREQAALEAQAIQAEPERPHGAEIHVIRPDEAQAMQAKRERVESDKQIWPSTSGGWTRSDSSVFADTANRWLHIAANGTYDDKAEKVVDISLPVVVEGRARLVSGGLGYTFPSFEFPFGPGGADHFGITSAGIWPYTLDITTARPVPSENTWITFRAIFRQDGGQIYAKYDTDTSFFPGQSKSWTVTNHISAIRFRQHWDSVCDLDYLIIADYRNN